MFSIHWYHVIPAIYDLYFSLLISLNHVLFLFQLIDITKFGLFVPFESCIALYSQSVDICLCLSLLIAFKPHMVLIQLIGITWTVILFFFFFSSWIIYDFILNAFVSYHPGYIWSLFQLVDFIWTTYGSCSNSLILLELQLFSLSVEPCLALCSHGINIVSF